MDIRQQAFDLVDKCVNDYSLYEDVNANTSNTIEMLNNARNASYDSCGVLLNHLIDNFSGSVDLPKESCDITKQAARDMLHTPVDDVVINDLSDTVFPLYIVKLVFRIKQVSILIQVREWKLFTRKYMYLITDI